MAQSVGVYARVIKGYVVVSEDHRTKGNAVYSRITLSTMCECVRRGVGVSVVGPKECQGQSHQKYEVLYIPNLPAQLRRRGRGCGQMLEVRGWYRHSRVTRGGAKKK